MFKISKSIMLVWMLFLFFDGFEGTAKISVAIKSSSRVWHNTNYFFSGELEFKIRDVIEMTCKRVHDRDGFRNGKNLRTGETGKFPLYKTKDVLNVVEYPEYTIEYQDG